MMETLTGNDYALILRAGASRLGTNRKDINDLNVFPIPDGDTGDNMYMTISAGCDAIAQAGDLPLGELASRASSGMLMGARGNSGVILSRIFAGIAKGLASCESADVSCFAKAMESGVAEAYGAVSNPVEGTILTVLKDGSKAALDASARDFEGYFDAFCRELSLSLDRTPQLLEVLRKAGVVDSGGAGLLCIAEGMRAALKGETVDLGASSAPSASAPKADFSAFTEDSVLEFGYCTEFVLRLQTSKVDLGSFDEAEIKDYLNAVGESVVCFREGSIVKVHVHTMTPGDILSHCQRWGEFLSVKVENMTLQHNEIQKPEQKKFQGPRKAAAVVSVASGSGLVELFREMGSDFVIEGGQTMNPSSEDFLKAFDSLNAETVYVLPDNSNIVLAAQQAASLYKEAEVVVLPVKSIGAGYTLLGSVDFQEMGREEIVAAAEEIASSVVSGMVSKAVRDADGVRAGEYIAFRGKEILCSVPRRNDALAVLCEELGADSADILLVVAGCDVPEQEAADDVEELQKRYRRTEVAALRGDQPVYDYIVIIQ